MFSVGLLIGKRPFQDGAMPEKNYPFQETLPKSYEVHYSSAEYRRPHCKQDERSSLPRSAQSEAFVILLQETHCTDAKKLVLPKYQLAGFF